MTRYRGIGKNLNHLQVLFASANRLMRARAVALAAWQPSASTASGNLCPFDDGGAFDDFA